MNQVCHTYLYLCDMTVDTGAPHAVMSHKQTPLVYVWHACIYEACHKYVACCSVLQCVAVCCSVLQWASYIVMSHICIHKALVMSHICIHKALVMSHIFIHKALVMSHICIHKALVMSHICIHELMSHICITHPRGASRIRTSHVSSWEHMCDITFICVTSYTYVWHNYAWRSLQHTATHCNTLHMCDALYGYTRVT